MDKFVFQFMHVGVAVTDYTSKIDDNAIWLREYEDPVLHWSVQTENQLRIAIV